MVFALSAMQFLGEAGAEADEAGEMAAAEKINPGTSLGEHLGNMQGEQKEPQGDGVSPGLINAARAGGGLAG